MVNPNENYVIHEANTQTQLDWLDLQHSVNVRNTWYYYYYYGS